MLAALVNLYSFVVLAAVILSWFPEARRNVVGQLVTRATEPLFARVRRLLPPTGGLDLAPLVVLLLLQVLRGLLR
jgi:YggT family protein